MSHANADDFRQHFCRHRRRKAICPQGGKVLLPRAQQFHAQECCPVNSLPLLFRECAWRGCLPAISGIPLFIGEHFSV
jgi:hypothetical protein